MDDWMNEINIIERIYGWLGDVEWMMLSSVDRPVSSVTAHLMILAKDWRVYDINFSFNMASKMRTSDKILSVLAMMYRRRFII